MDYFIKWRGGLLAIALLMVNTPPAAGEGNKANKPALEKQDKLTRNLEEIHEARMNRTASMMTSQLGMMGKKNITLHDLECFYAQADEICRLEKEYLVRCIHNSSKTKRSISSVERGRHDDIMDLLKETREAAKLARSLFEDGKGKAATTKLNQAEKSLRQAMQLMAARSKAAATAKPGAAPNTKNQSGHR